GHCSGKVGIDSFSLSGEDLMQRLNKNGPVWLLLSLLLMIVPSLSSRIRGAPTSVTITSPTLFATLDASDGATDGVYNVSGDLTIANGGANPGVAPGRGPGAPSTRRVNVGGDAELRAGGALLPATARGHRALAQDLVAAGRTF